MVLYVLSLFDRGWPDNHLFLYEASVSVAWETIFRFSLIFLFAICYMLAFLYYNTLPYPVARRKSVFVSLKVPQTCFTERINANLLWKYFCYCQTRSMLNIAYFLDITLRCNMVITPLYPPITGRWFSRRVKWKMGEQELEMVVHALDF